MHPRARGRQPYAVPCVALLLMLLSPALVAPGSAGSSVLREGPGDFEKGYPSGTDPARPGLMLSPEESLLGNWTRMDRWPTPRYYHAMAFDGASARTILFGGFDGTGCLGDTWTFELSSNNWTRKFPQSSPPARQSPAMAYDPVVGVVVLFGGANETSAFNDTWTYNVGQNIWRRMSPSSSPAARWAESYEMVSAGGVLVLFGGGNQTWTYSPSADAWTQKTTEPAPPSRQFHSLAGDSGRGQAVLFGGETGSAAGDTWVYNVSQNVWANVTSAGSPPPRYGHAMAYDSRSDVMVVFSGYDRHGLILNDTWTFDPGALKWTEGKPALMPHSRCYYSLASDESQHELVMFSGAALDWHSADTWTYNASSDSWARKTKAPAERLSPAFSYDRAGRLAVLFGGQDPNTCFCDTWTYDYRKNAWTERTPAGSPGARTASASVYDSRYGVTVMFGGRWGDITSQTLDDTWTYNATMNVWKNQRPDSSPTARASHAMAYDSARNVVVLFGGRGPFGITNDTWLYAVGDNRWSQVHPAASPPSRQEHALAYDGASGLVVLFGGVGSADKNDTWTYNVSSNIWTRMSPPAAPDPRTASMAADDLRGELVLAGGCTSDQRRVFNDTWTYDVLKDQWTQRSPLPWSSGRARMGLASDSASGVIVLFGGGYNGFQGDTWTYSLKRYAPGGIFTSRPHDTGGSAYFGTVEWDAALASNTSIGLQLRTADSEDGLESERFLGPDGTPSSRYDQSGIRVHPGHNGSRWMQYRAFLCTTEPADTPVLEELRLKYNLPPEVFISSPVGGELWSGIQNITWEASDPDGDGLGFDLYLVDENLTSAQPLATNLSSLSGWEWDTSIVPSGNYFVHIECHDRDPDIPLTVNYSSPMFTVSNAYSNRAPYAFPLRPTEGEVLATTTVTLEWAGSDPDGDALTYFVFLVDGSFDPGKASPPVAATTQTSYTAFNLRKGATYYWAVLANDGKVNGSISGVLDFRIIENRPPSARLVAPEQGALQNTSAVALAWSGDDPDQDAVTYTVYLAAYGFELTSIPAPLGTTRDTSFPVSNLLNGTTYFWTVVPSDGEARGPGAPVQCFTVSVVVPERSPRVTDWAPKSTDVAVKPTVMVAFDRDMDADSVFSAMSFDPPVDISAFVRYNTTFHISLGAELSHSRTYRIMVNTSARSIDGHNLAAPFQWSFATVAEGKRDASLPQVSFTDPPDGAGNVGNRSNITIVFSESMDRIATERAVEFEPFLNLTWYWLDQKGYAVRFRPLSDIMPGKYRVKISASARDESGNPLDGNRNGVSDNASEAYLFSFTVGPPPRPHLLSWSPVAKGVGLNQSIRLAFDRRMNLTSVEQAFRLVPAAPGSWRADPDGRNITFTPSWNLRPGTKYSVTVLSNASDAEGNPLDESELWSFTTTHAPSQRAETPWLLLVALLVLSTGAAGGAWYRWKRAQANPAAPVDYTAGALDAVEPGAGPAASAGSPAEPRPPPQPAAPAVLPFVEDLFLLHKDGRLLRHIDRHPVQDAGSGEMLIRAVQAFSLMGLGASGSPRPAMEYGGRTVLFERGSRLVLACSTGAQDAGSLRDEMSEAVKKIESEFGPVLARPDLSPGDLDGAGRILEPLGVRTVPEIPKIPGAANVTVKASLELFRGFVRLKVAARNPGPAALSGAGFRLGYDREAFRLDFVDPELKADEGRFAIGTLEPGEWTVLSFYLAPQACAETYLEGALTYVDPHGNAGTSPMPRKLATVTSPVLDPEGSVEVGMLEKIVGEQLEHRDHKVFALPPGISPPEAFTIAKAAVARNDLRLIRELSEKDPFIGEAWYHGKAKGQDDKVVIRARVLEAKNALEFFVASSSTLMLVGMLAELKAGLSRELKALRMKETLSQVTSQKELDAVSVTMTLLEKAAQAERQAGAGS